MWKYDQDNTGFSNIYIKGWKGMEYDIPEVNRTRSKTKSHLPSKTEYNTSGEIWSFNEIEDFQTFLMKRPELKRKFTFKHKNQEKCERVNSKEKS